MVGGSFRKSTNSVDGDWDNKSSSQTMSDGSGTIEERDEIKEIEKFSKEETRRVQIWRLLVTFLLTTTGAVVASVTYKVLLDQEETNFEDAFERFSQTVGDAAVREMLRLREAIRTIADVIVATSKLQNTSWPYYSYPPLSVFVEEQWRSKGFEHIALLTRVRHEERDDFIKWTNSTHEEWVKEGHLRAWGSLDELQQDGFQNDILGWVPAGDLLPSPEKDEYYPLSFRFPPPHSYFTVLFDISSINYDNLFAGVKALKNETLLSIVEPYIEGSEAEARYHAKFHSQLPGSNVAFPHSFMFHPVHRELENYDSDVVAVLDLPVAWDASLRNLLPDNVEGIVVVGRNTCGQDFTYEIVGKDAFYIGDGDKHDTSFDSYEVVVNLDFHEHPDFFDYPGHCAYKLSIYPSDTFKDTYTSSTPKLYVALVASTFFLMIVVFYVYDWFVQRRNRKLVVRAAKSNEIVASMFPTVLQDKMFGNAMLDEAPAKGTFAGSRRSTTSRMRSAASGKLVLNNMNDAPLAELYLDTTVMFADVVGFTAWASVREPPQVFKLLETVFQAFDNIARSRRIFKVETVGDCYVAVSGFPEPQKDHAVRMCRFAYDCKLMFDRLVNELEVSLGPDTGDLSLRMGIHSGQVTAGLLRGDRARFQLFGDTVNTTARMESTSESGRIQVSLETAELLLLAGKKTWLTKREDLVEAKGKGQLQTFWMVPVRGGQRGGREERPSYDEDNSDPEFHLLQDLMAPVDTERERMDRLIDWNTSTLLTMLKKIVARREILQEHGLVKKDVVDETGLEVKETFLEEVKEIIELPEFDAKAVMGERDPNVIQLNEAVTNQLRDYIQRVASLYRRNPFHNFEHASHVTMSVYKLLSRIVAPSDLDLAHNEDKKLEMGPDHEYESNLHDHTYGITSDPLTQFACAFSALIHDVDHTGVPNTRLIEENEALGSRYKNRSVAEQNSLQIAWDMLMEKKYADLRSTIYANQTELKRFRELVVNGVMATDISDKDLKNLRNGRWDKAFKKDENGNNLAVDDTGRDAVNRKATIVIEHLIQASDVAHTMQHWHVYRKWNERLFEELYVSWQQGRATGNPADFWAKGEIGFFDFYVIPLAKKLKDCGVFGISSAEYLSYAMKNRREWLAKGEGIVAEMVEKLKAKEESTVQVV